MTDKEKFRQEVEKLKSNLMYGACSSQIAMETRCKEEAYNEVLAILDSMQEEPVSEELEDAASSFARKDSEEISNPADFYYIVANKVRIFKAGAKWQKEQMTTKSIEAVVSQVPCANEIILYNPSSVDYYYLPQEMNKLGLNKGDKIKLVIIKED